MNKLDKSARSAGLAYMLAAKAAAPKSLGDRERIAVMGASMDIAVRNRFPFKPDDAEELANLGIRTCVGVFRPLDQCYYRIACLVGGTYPRMWEAYHGLAPWKAAVAVIPYHFRIRDDLLENTRVTTDIGVLMPQSFGPDEPELASHLGLQVWWVTSCTGDTVNLCRYSPSTGYAGHLQRPGGAPARRRQVDRDAWGKYQAEAKAAWAGRTNPDQRPTFVGSKELAEAV